MEVPTGSELVDYERRLRETLVKTWEQIRLVDEQVKQKLEERINRGRHDPKIRVGDTVAIPRVNANKL